MDKTSTVPVLKVTESGRTGAEETVAREFPLTIVFNNKELVTMLCSPDALEELAVGFLFSEGLLQSKDELGKVLADPRRGIVRVETRGEREVDTEQVFKRFITSGCGRGASFYSPADAQAQPKIESGITIAPQAVFTLMSEFQHRSEVFRATGGVHSAALSDGEKILVFAEDIGRHNALDKIFGQCLLKDMSLADRIILTSGRISSEMLLKVARRKIPVVISKSAPTDLGVKLARDLGVTLIGFVRGKRMNVYANEERVVA
ncbi:MAG: formate dehydrogenase accessory sulfurtransferase FdhD [Chloroflexota bacterium]